MPNTGKRADPPTEEEKARIVTGPDPDRFYCPHPGCNRSFAELWRLKVHFRAPPDVRGSGKERGHGTELKFCPKCGKDLRPGKHHVGCSAGKSAPRQAAKRQRQQQMSTTTESAQGLTAGTTTEQTTSSWEHAVRRQAAKQRLASEAESTQRSKRMEACRIETLVQNLDAQHAGDLLFRSNAAAAAAGPRPGPALGDARQPQQHFFGHAQPGMVPQQQAGLSPAQQLHGGQVGQAQGAPAQLPQLDLPQHGELGQRPLSPSPLDLFGDPFGASNGHGGGGAAAAGPHDPFGGHEDELRIPSPPPLPADWDVGPRSGLLFDFDQFDASKRQQAGTSAPLVTVTTAMNPVDMLNPSDDYIWQILFAGENDAVPKRVTAHLHHPPSTSLSYLDEADPLLDAILADDLGPLPEAPHQHAQHAQHAQHPQQQTQHAQQGQQGPPPQQQYAAQGGHGNGHGHVNGHSHGHLNGHVQGLGGGLDPVGDRLVPMGNGSAPHLQHAPPHQQQHPQQHMHPSLGAVLHHHHPAAAQQHGGQPQHRNGYGSHGPGAELAPPAVKLDSTFV